MFGDRMGLYLPQEINKIRMDQVLNSGNTKCKCPFLIFLFPGAISSVTVLIIELIINTMKTEIVWEKEKEFTSVGNLYLSGVVTYKILLCTHSLLQICLDRSKVHILLILLLIILHLRKVHILDIHLYSEILFKITKEKKNTWNFSKRI